MNVPTYEATADPVIQALVAEAAADPDVIGLVLTGSRAVGVVTTESDYDIVFVVTNEALDRYERDHQAPARGKSIHPPISTADMWHQSPRTLRPEHTVSWMLPAWAESRILYDRTGETALLIDALRLMPEGTACEEVAAWYDAYLNGLYRSLKAWRRGNVFGARLEAAQTADYVLHVLFALEQRWRPYSSRLPLHLSELSAQGWQPDELSRILLDLIATGNPQRQQVLAHRIVALMRDRGFAHVYDSWNGQIDLALAWTFA